MNSAIHRSGWLRCVLVPLCMYVASAGLCPTLGQPAESVAPQADRNPFAGLVGQDEPQPQSVLASLLSVAHPDVQLETIVLKFLDATSLKGVLDKMVSPYGSVAVNQKTNSVIVCDTPENLSRILGEIKKADQTPMQIMVEVVILDVQLKDDTEIGVNWDLLSTDLEDITYRQNVTGPRLTAVPPSAATLGNATAYNTLGLGGDFSVISGSVRHVLHTIQQKRDVEILASPRALVVSGQMATIKAVEEIPYRELIDTATGGANAMTTTQFKEVGVTLKVKATVTDGNNIYLDVNTTQNVTAALSEGGVPVVDTREAVTALLLRDSQTVIIGGLRREEKTRQVNQIPILGDLPLIGLLFKSTDTVTAHSELVVLLSPHIYRGGPIPGEITAKLKALQSRSPLKAQVITEPNESEPSQAQE